MARENSGEEADDVNGLLTIMGDISGQELPGQPDSGEGAAKPPRMSEKRMSGPQRSNTVDRVEVEIEVVIGRTRMPVHHLLRMGRGAVIELDSNENDEVEILANGFPVARGQVIVQGKRIEVEVTSLIRRPEVERAISNAAAQAAMAKEAEEAMEEAAASPMGEG